jgi:hypothetical protein
VVLLAGGLTAHAWYRPSDDLFRLVSIEPPLRDFGPVRQNESLAHDFAVRNNGTELIEVVKVLAGCSCTTADGFVGTVLSPGQTLPLHVTFKPGQNEGPRSGTITVFYKGPSTVVPAWKSLTVQATVGTDYMVAPTLVDFGTVNSDEHPSRRIHLRPNQQLAVQVTGLESDDPGFRIQQVPAPPGDSDLHFDIEPRYQAIRHSGPVSTFVHIRTDSLRAPVTDVLVRAMVVATTEVEPESIVIGSDVVGSVRRDIILRTRSPARVTAVRAAGVRCEYDGGVAVRHKVAMTIPGDLGSGKFAVEIDIELKPGMGAWEARTITIPVHRFPRQKGE